MSSTRDPSPEGDAPEGGDTAAEGDAPGGADNAAGGADGSVSPPLDAGGASTGSRAVSMVVLLLLSSGKVAMLSGVMVSTGAAGLFPLLEAVSPVEEVTFFPHPTNGITIMAHKTIAETMREITHCGIAHLFFS
jgi:hypothetical protein